MRPLLQVLIIPNSWESSISGLFIGSSGGCITWISTCRHNSELHTAFFHLFESKMVQFRTDSMVLIIRMHGKQFNFS